MARERKWNVGDISIEDSNDGSDTPYRVAFEDSDTGIWLTWDEVEELKDDLMELLETQL